MSDLPQGRSRFPVLATGGHDCPYLPERTARTAFIDPGARPTVADYAELLRRGFRRSGAYVYRPACPGCDACRSLRIPVREFRPQRRHRRCLRRNARVSLHPLPATYRDEHFRLYRRYLASRHPGGGMDDPTPESYYGFLTAPWCDTRFLEIREDGHLLAVAVVDDLGDSLSAVYTFFEPDLPVRGLGTLAILLEIHEAARHGYDHLYLGYWIEQCARMSYKAEFRPHEVLTRDGRWRRVHDGAMRHGIG